MSIQKKMMTVALCTLLLASAGCKKKAGAGAGRDGDGPQRREAEARVDPLSIVGHDRHLPEHRSVPERRRRHRHLRQGVVALLRHGIGLL